MLKNLNKEVLIDWYKDNKITADRIINDLRKKTYEAMMHIYAYTVKQLHLEYVVSQQDFPTLFSNNYTRVDDTIIGIMALLIGEWNITFNRDKVKMVLAYWLVCGNMYETLVSKIMIKAEEAKERTEQNGFLELKQCLVDTSIKNVIKIQKNWDVFFHVGDGPVADSLVGGNNSSQISSPELQTEAVDNNSSLILSPELQTKASDNNSRYIIPPELQTKAAQQILNKAISKGLCDNKYHWLKTQSLLAYFADFASKKLVLSKAEQDGKKKTSWKPFEILFRTSGLSNCKNTYKNKTGRLPIDHEIVESIFR